jgi:hypothetical protein
MASQPPPNPYQQPYQPPSQYYGYPPPSRGTNTMAILALVFAFVFAPAAIVLGHIARKQIQQTGEDGDALALAGLIVGYVFTGLFLLFCVGYVIFAVVMGAAMFATSSGY